MVAAESADTTNKAVGGFVSSDYAAAAGEVLLSITTADPDSLVTVSVPARTAYESDAPVDETRPSRMLMKVPKFESPAFTVPRPLDQATVAIVTTAALHVEGEAFEAKDATYRSIDRAQRNLMLGHWSPNFDRSGFAIDLNVVYPIDRLEELAERGVIGAVASKHLSFSGIQPDGLAAIRHDSGPAAAQELIEASVDIVILTPV